MPAQGNPNNAAKHTVNFKAGGFRGHRRLDRNVRYTMMLLWSLETALIKVQLVYGKGDNKGSNSNNSRSNKNNKKKQCRITIQYINNNNNNKKKNSNSGSNEKGKNSNKKSNNDTTMAKKQ